VILVDTPGFNDTWKSNMDTLRCIADWLKERSAYLAEFFFQYLSVSRYRSEHKLAGIIFLHEISQARLISPEVLSMLEAFCGYEAAKNVVVVTTKWSDAFESLGEKHEKKLSEHLSGLFRHGMRKARFWHENGRTSAWDIIDSILKQGPINSIQIQRDLVDLRRLLKDTEAGISLGSHIKHGWNAMVLDVFTRLFNLKSSP
jgi:hypothetical protein